MEEGRQSLTPLELAYMKGFDLIDDQLRAQSEGDTKEAQRLEKLASEAFHKAHKENPLLTGLFNEFGKDK